MTSEDRFPVKRWIHKRLAILNFKNFLFCSISAMPFYISQPLALFSWCILTLIHLMDCLKCERTTTRIGLCEAAHRAWQVVCATKPTRTHTQVWKNAKERKRLQDCKKKKRRNDDPVKITILLFIAVGHLAYISSNRSVPIYSIHCKMFAGPFMPPMHTFYAKKNSQRIFIILIQSFILPFFSQTHLFERKSALVFGLYVSSIFCSFSINRSVFNTKLGT